MAAVTLKMRTRSNGQYVTNGVVQGIIYQSRINSIIQNIEILPILFPTEKHVSSIFDYKISLEDDI